MRTRPAAVAMLAFSSIALSVAAQQPPAAPAHPPQTDPAVALVLVKDFLRMRNDGAEVADLELQRYSPKCDSEQFIIGRWLAATADSGRPVAAAITAVEPDPAGNQIHTLRLDRFPADDQVVITITTLVARRERRPPTGEFPIPPKEDYPEAVRPYLRSTPMVDAKHPIVRSRAKRLAEKSGGDALKLARLIAATMRTKTYETQGEPDPDLPLSAIVLRHGGSCCASAVCAAAMFRAGGVPAQVTYTPAGYIHGIVQFYLQGHGWVRMDSTSGTGRLPLVQSRDERGLVRLFDTPIEMEKMDFAFMWPYFHNTLTERYQFRSAGKSIPTIRFAMKDEEAARAGRDPGWVQTPMPHIEPGSWNTVLDVVERPVADDDWDALSAAARGDVAARRTGLLPSVREPLGAILSPDAVRRLLAAAARYGPLDAPAAAEADD